MHVIKKKMNTSEETLVPSENMRIYHLRRLLAKTYDMNNMHWKSVINMTNGIMGISILAMPYCFSQCGILLGTLSLFFIALLTSYSCKLLIHSSDMKRTRSLEYLALCTLGTNGKIFTELCVISLLFGSLVTYQEALGDSGPSLIAKLFDINVI
jgi:solute carrier family 38 (sodium-coupled neutral amino acid transporter), member 10